MDYAKYVPALLGVISSALSFASGAYAQELTPTMAPYPTYPCQPVAYVFRHAEDINPGNDLTPAGYRHAATYPAMIQDLERRNNFCPVSRVYSMNTKNPDGSPGTLNPIKTARPLSYVSGLEGKEPKISLTCKSADGTTSTRYLNEFFQKSGSSTRNNATTIKCLKDDIKVRLNAGGSVAFFWSSDGMQNFTQQIFGSWSPAKAETPRNVVYVARWGATFNGSIPSAGASFDAFTYNAAVQCFNYQYPTGSDAGRVGRKYYCQYSGILNRNGVIPSKFLPFIDGKVCNKNDINSEFIGDDVYGYCSYDTGKEPQSPITPIFPPL